MAYGYTNPTNRHSGFTVVELLIVIVTIALLAAIVTQSYGIIQAHARDSERKSDVLVLKDAINKYYDANGAYPLPSSGCAVNSGCYVNLLSSLLVPTYIPTIPSPPSGTNYAYVRGADTEENYAIYTSTEVIPSCKTGVKMNATWWGSGTPSCNF